MFFNGYEFDAVEIDLEHINRGKQKLRQSQFDVEQVLNIIKILIHFEYLLSVGLRVFQDESYLYFAKSGIVKNKKYRIVFCICSDRPKTIGIITLFRIGEKK